MKQAAKPRDGSDVVIRDLEEWLKRVIRLDKDALADSKKERNYSAAALWQQSEFCYKRALEQIRYLKQRAKRA